MTSWCTRANRSRARWTRPGRETPSSSWPGTYRESVLITKPGLTLRGTGERTVIAPPAAKGAKTAKKVKAANACAKGGNGICVIGTKSRTVDDVRIRSLTVSGFTKSGIWASWTDGLSVRRVAAGKNGTWGIAQERSTRGDFRHNTATGNGDAGIFVANSVSEEGGATDTGGTLVVDNSVSGNRIGVTARRVRNLVIDGNTLDGQLQRGLRRGRRVQARGRGR